MGACCGSKGDEESYLQYSGNIEKPTKIAIQANSHRTRNQDTTNSLFSGSKGSKLSS